jgi:hypothetical protein
VSVSQEKWDKAKRLIKSLWDPLEKAGVIIAGSDLSKIEMNYKELEVARGFLVHLSMTFEMLTHHLKGFHLALASYLPQRSEDGWKMSDAEGMSYLSLKVENNLMSEAEAELLSTRTKVKEQSEPPQTVPLIKHLRDDIWALREFFDLVVPPEIQARRQSVHMLSYIFAYESSGGLGSTVSVPGIGVRCRVGVWGKDDESLSSNFKEFENIVQTI